jgi:hypothetical protein
MSATVESVQQTPEVARTPPLPSAAAPAPAPAHTRSFSLDRGVKSGHLVHDDREDSEGARHTRSFAVDNSVPSLKIAHDDRRSKSSDAS